jgi:hypothetical protein
MNLSGQPTPTPAEGVYSATLFLLPSVRYWPSRTGTFYRACSGSFIGANAQNSPIRQTSHPGKSFDMLHFLHHVDCCCLLDKPRLHDYIRSELPPLLDRGTTCFYNE